VIKQKFNQLTSKAKLLIVLAVTILANFFMLPLTRVFATTYLTKPQVILTNMNAGGTSSVIIEFTTSSSNTGTSLTLQFPSYTGTTAGIVNGTQTVSGSYNGTNCTSITGASADVPGTSAATVSSQTITFTSVTAYTISTSYCIVLSSTSAVTNPTETGVVSAVVTAGTDAASHIGRRKSRTIFGLLPSELDELITVLRRGSFPRWGMT